MPGARVSLLGNVPPAARPSRNVLLAAAVGLACVVCLAIVSRGSSATALYLPDGVYPEKDLPFTKALKAHYSSVKRVGDVKARGALEVSFGAATAARGAKVGGGVLRPGILQGPPAPEGCAGGLDTDRLQLGGWGARGCSCSPSRSHGASQDA